MHSLAEVNGAGGSGGTLGDYVFSLWNPHATQRVRLYGLSVNFGSGSIPGAGLTYSGTRISTEGTWINTQTFGISNDHRRAIAAPSAVRLNWGVSVLPTQDGNIIDPTMVWSGVQGEEHRHVWVKGLWIPPGAGFGMQVTSSGPAGARADFVFLLSEDDDLSWVVPWPSGQVTPWRVWETVWA